ncbi:unnamed protein product [Protopolystoma xenopodis]|uniref:Uncharacterized protein n=1 Tax=Protopolystoma xenopodis TaxID=117903 RepID=A0A3S5B0T2_9PLAT|nr:unnamed protein product [Protopolystoma xenopodis]
MEKGYIYTRTNTHTDAQTGDSLVDLAECLDFLLGIEPSCMSNSNSDRKKSHSRSCQRFLQPGQFRRLGHPTVPPVPHPRPIFCDVH